MDKRSIGIIVLAVALLVAVIGFISISARVGKAAAEKNKLTRKIEQTVSLTAKLNKNVSDLKMMLNKVESEKKRLTDENKDLLKRNDILKKELNKVLKQTGSKKTK